MTEQRREYLRQWRASHPGYYAKRSRAWREINPDYAKAYRLSHPSRSNPEAHDKWMMAHPGAHYQRVKAWIKANPEKYKAHQHVQRALKRGEIKRQPCETCGKAQSHAHHSNYAKPLDVTWLCALHHRQEHRL